MNTRERVLNILRYQPVDRLPAIWFGSWNELLVEWAEQGHLSMELARAWGDGNDADKEIMARLGFEYNWQNVPGPASGLWPGFEREVVAREPDGFVLVRNGEGVIERLREGAGSIPGEVDWLLKDRESFEALFRDKLVFREERVNLEGIRWHVAANPPGDPIGIHCGSVLGNLRNVMTVMGMSYLLADDYELVREMIALLADTVYESVRRVLESGLRFDYGHFWEDICFKNGPLIPPDMFADLCGPHYRRMTDLLRQHGIDLVSLDCDGKIDELLPIWLENGVTVMFPIEVGTWRASLIPWREQYGRRLLGVGGMDKTVLREDRAAVDAELERLRPQVALGGFIPCPDHSLMPGTKFELVQYYAERIRSMPV